MKAPRDWTLLGRPIGEWLFLLLMAASGANSLRELSPAAMHGAAQWSVLIADAIVGLTSLGVVLATLAGWKIGIRLLWFFALAASFVAPMATWAWGGAPAADVVMAGLGGVAVSAGVVWYGRRRLHASITRRQWPMLLADHAAAADDFVAAINALSADTWSARPSPDAWSPAEITEHLARTYSQYAGESRGKDSLRVRLNPVKLLVARALVKPRLLAGAPFPKSRAPRALRPSAGPDTAADGVALFRATGDACLRDLGILVERRPYKTLIHPYLGALPLYEVVRFAVQHIHHHRRQLLAGLSTSRPRGNGNDVAS